jgi:hypothetical protein
MTGQSQRRAEVLSRPDAPFAELRPFNGFRSWFMGGFECSTHRRADGRRLDVIAATRHDALAREDYALLQQAGISTVRDGLRWHLIEERRGHYDWSSALPMLRAARGTGTQVIWDLMHYGWPDGLDIWSEDFIAHFARFAGQAAEIIAREAGEAPVISVINELSFMSWAGGTMAIFNPGCRDRGDELKRHLVRATLAACDAIWEAVPDARVIHIDPMIHVVPDPDRPETADIARALNASQFQAWDMIAGRQAPELGGAPHYLDLVGVNFYCHNQWIAEGGPIDWQANDPRYKAPRQMLADIHARYGRPILMAETGIEADLRARWFRFVCGEVEAAQSMGVEMLGICLYPVMNHPGWEDDRHCPNGLIDYCRSTFARTPDPDLLAELIAQQERRRTRFDEAAE